MVSFKMKENKEGKIIWNEYIFNNKVTFYLRKIFTKEISFHFIDFNRYEKRARSTMSILKFSSWELRSRRKLWRELSSIMYYLLLRILILFIFNNLFVWRVSNWLWGGRHAIRYYYWEYKKIKYWF